MTAASPIAKPRIAARIANSALADRPIAPATATKQASWNGPAGSATVVWSKVSWLAAIATAAQAIARTWRCGASPRHRRSEEHTFELQSLMSSSYAVFCLKYTQQKNQNKTTSNTKNTNEQQTHPNNHIIK